MCIYVYICADIDVPLSISLCVKVYMYMYNDVHLCIDVPLSLYIYIYIHTYTYMYTCTCTSMYIPVHMHRYACIFKYYCIRFAFPQQALKETPDVSSRQVFRDIACQAASLNTFGCRGKRRGVVCRQFGPKCSGTLSSQQRP